MIIQVAAAIGRGVTRLAAFDAALVSAGVADRNLIYLSSVLPPASLVEPVARVDQTPGDWGDRLYCVMAHAETAEPATEVWAGIGWMQDSSGRGLLVEHEAGDEVSVRDLVAASLGALGRNRGQEFPLSGTRIAGVRCAGEPVCALVVAVFESAAWNRLIDRLVAVPV
jgi:arginine decarboxylase